MKTTSWFLSSLPTPNSTLLKPLYLLYTTTLSKPWVNSKPLHGLCLLDLSAAFDTIDHTIPLHRLKSWFGFTGTVLSWIQSYLSSRSFTVDINGIKSPPSKLLHSVPQGSVLGPLLFILYTTPLSLIISQSSVNHKLYADDTQLFLSFSADTFSENILLQDAKYYNQHFFMDGLKRWNVLPHHLRSHSHSSQSHSLLSLSSSQFHKQPKLTFFFILIFLILSSLYWTDPLELWSGLFVIHYSFHIPHHRSVHLLNSL